MKKKEVAKTALSDIIFDSIKNTGIKSGEYLLENAGLTTAQEVLGATVLDTASGVIPIIGDAFRNYRIQKRFENIEIFLKELEVRIDDFIIKNDNLTSDNKEVYNELFSFAIDSVTNYHQSEKIKYLVNGLEEIINVEKISYDIGYLYINTLNQLTLLDITVVKFYNSGYYYYIQEDSEVEFETYMDILTKFNIEYHQYDAVRDNLYNLGILQRKNEKNIKKDFKNIKENLERIDKNLINLHSDIADLTNPRKKNAKLNKLETGRVKFEIDDKYIISKFGQDFFQYFLNEQL